MIVNFAKIDQSERPTIILNNASGDATGVLGYAKNVEPDIKFNEVSALDFEYPAWVDGKPTPHYNSLVGLREVELQDVGKFILINPTEIGDGVQKTKKCKGYSLEYEFTFKKISLTKGTYNLWNPLAPENTLIGMILELMPSWSIGSVDSSLIGVYRTFEVNNENLYNLMKGTCQESYSCIFDFNTYDRMINIIDVSSFVPTQPVYLSHDNLIKELEIKEDTESIVTRLDVNGADGVTIRDVNPTGTNKIINLDYYMTPDNFPQSIIDKYYSWKQIYEENQRPYYNLMVEYVLETMRKVTEYAALTELNHEKTNLENIQAVAIQAIARGLATQSDLDTANANIAIKQAEVDEQKELVASIEDSLVSLLSQLKDINVLCSFERYFTEAEYGRIDRYIKDDEIAESSFAATNVVSYTSEDIGNRLENVQFSIENSSVVRFSTQSEKEIYDVSGGVINVGGLLNADVITAAFEVKSDNTFVATAYLDAGVMSDSSFSKACVSLTGTISTVTSDVLQNMDTPSLYEGTRILADIHDGYIYFTLNTSEYERRSVAWELYNYGMEVLNKLSKPTYSFTISSANFLSLAEFTAFKQNLVLGNRLYIEKEEDDIITPILIGAKFSYDDLKKLELEFGNSYVAGDSAFELADIIEQSISLGKNLDISRYSYAAFVDSGANTTVSEFMKSALDVAKNAIISSEDQAISWDSAGIRLRKWANEAQTAYEPEQIWMNNNSIMMTDDNWATASIAIGKFHDANVGDCWGIIAPRIVGTILAGGNLVIESSKQDGGTAVFRVDGEGCYLYNSDFNIVGTNRHIALNPQIGIALGSYPVYTVDNGVYTVNDENAKFWVDTEGNLHFKGTIHASNGEFTGYVTATRLTIVAGEDAWSIDDYIAQNDAVINMQDIANEKSQVFTSTPTPPYHVGDLWSQGTSGDLMICKVARSEDEEFSESDWVKASKYTDDSTANNIHDGTTGIYFTSGSALETCEITTANGVKLTGAAGDYFKVTNSGMGFFDKNSNATLYFSNGNLTVSGTMYAKAGTIGSWTIKEDEIIAGEWADGTQMGLRFGDAEWGIWAGSGKFRVQPNGFVYAENVDISGSITATGGTIGGFTIGTADTTGTIPNALYCGGKVNSSPTATGMSASNAQWAFWAGNGVFRVTQSGNLYATNATLSGTFTSGNWVLDSSGYRYSNGSNNVRMTVSGGTAYYQTYGYNAYYGSNSYDDTIIEGSNVQLRCASTGQTVSARRGNYGYNYNQVCLICDDASNSGDTWSGSSGNCGITEKRWDVGWFRVMHYDTRPTSSSLKLKHDIRDLVDFGDTIDKLRPVSFVYNNDEENKKRYGLIYEETLEALPEICRRNVEGNNELLGIEYDDLISILLKEIQELRKRVALLENCVSGNS